MCKREVNRGLKWVLACVAAGLLLGTSMVTLSSPASAPSTGVFNRRGNIVIADQFNNRVIEVDGNHNIVWQFGDGSNVAGPTSVVAPNDAERIAGGLTLIAGTGAPGGTDGCGSSGCPDNRVILVDQSGNIVWQYGHTGVAGTDDNYLNTPVCAVFLPNKDVLITDQGNERVIEVDPLKHAVVWQYGTTGVIGKGPNQLNNPNSAELLENGDILIADENNNRVIEVNRAQQIVWRYGDPDDTSVLNGAAFASRACDGRTLITDSLNNRILDVTLGGNVVFNYPTNARKGSVANPNPTRAVRLCNGNILISDQFNHQVIEITPSGGIVFRQGKIGVAGSGPGLLNAPYDAKVVGDYTGLTPPFGPFPGF